MDSPEVAARPISNSTKGSLGGMGHQYSYNFLVGTYTGLYKPVQALKVKSLQEKHAMSDFA
jgi:hypothetical protein